MNEGKAAGKEEKLHEFFDFVCADAITKQAIS
jgi:hypothetical protein